MECYPPPGLPWKCGSYDLEAQMKQMPGYEQEKIINQANKNLDKTQTATKIALKIIKTTINIYDVISMPFYFLGQRPWKHWKETKWSQQVDPNEPHGPYIFTGKKHSLPHLDNVKTMDQLFRASVKVFHERPCLGTRAILGEDIEKQSDGKSFRKLILGDYSWITYNHAEQRVEKLARAMMASGIRPHDIVCIFADTRVEWMLTIQACFRTNVTVATLYATLGEDGIVHAMNETEIEYLFTTAELMDKLKKLMPRLLKLKYIIFMEGIYKPSLEGFPDSVTVISFSKFETFSDEYDEDLRSFAPTQEDHAIIMYTSGSTGIPKGVIITHRNIMATIICVMDTFPLERQELYIGYLPLAHILELGAECVFMTCGFPVGYSSPFTLTDNSTSIPKGGKGDATLLRPTIMCTVPLVLDRIRKAINEKVQAKGGLSKALFNYALKYKIRWYKKGFNTPIMDRIIFKKVKQVVGGRLRIMCCGGAPLSMDTHMFIKFCLGAQLMQGYGLTESSGCVSLMKYEDRSFGRVGGPVSSIDFRLEDWAEGGYRGFDRPNPRGEILISGNAVANGYYKNEEQTLESFRKDEKGVTWFYTGDIGEVFPDGSLKIIDRKKDLVKLQMGEYVSLGKVESELKTSPLVDNICVFGSGFHTYLVALVAPNSAQLTALGKELGKQNISYRELCYDRIVIAAATKSLIEHGIKCKLLKTEIPSKIKLCHEEWLPDTQLVTAAFKIRRRMIQQFYQNDIDKMYGITTEMNGGDSISS